MVQNAREVQSHGAPELVRAVERGEVSLRGSKVAELPEEKQREIVARGEKGILAAAKAIRAEKSEAAITART